MHEYMMHDKTYTRQLADCSMLKTNFSFTIYFS